MLLVLFQIFDGVTGVKRLPPIFYGVNMHSKCNWVHSRANLRISEFHNVIDFILFCYDVTDTRWLVPIVKMSLSILNVNNLICENTINSHSTHFLMQFLFGEKVSWFQYILAVRILLWNFRSRKICDIIDMF